MQADLTIKVAGDLTAIRSSLTGLRQDFKAVADAAAEVKNKAPKGEELASPYERAAGAVKRLVAGLAVAAAFRGFVDIADDMQNLNARLRLATEGADGFAKAQADVNRIAKETRSSLTAVGDLYTKLIRTSENLGTTQEQTADITEAVAKALKISGASAEESSAAILQLSQAFGSGVLQGDEFRSLAEAAPRLLQAIAKGMDVPIGALKQLGSEGKLTAASVAEALLKTKDDLDREFAAIPATVGDALTLVKNQIFGLVDSSNTSSGATRELAGELQNLADILGSPSFQQGFTTIITGLVRVIETSGKAVSALGEVTKFAAEEIAARANGAALDDIVRVEDELARAQEKLKNTSVLPQLLGITTKAYAEQAAVVDGLTKKLELSRQIQSQTAARGTPDAPRASGGPGDTQNVRDNAALAASKNLASSLAAQTAKMKEQAETYGKGKAALAEYAEAQALANANTIKDLDKREQAVANVKAAYKPLIDQARALDAVTQAQKANNKEQPIDPSQRAEAARAALAAQLKATDALYQDGKVSIRDYYDTKLSLGQQDIDAQIRQQQAEADTTKSLTARANSEAKIAQLQQQRAALGPAIANEQKKAEDALGESIRGVVEQYLELNNQMGVATRLQLEDQFKGLRQKLTTEGDTAGVGLLDNVINTRAARAQLQQFESDFQTTISRLQSVEQSFTNQVTTGALTPLEAQERINDARRDALPTLQANIDAVRRLADETADPRAIQAVMDLTNQMQQATVISNQFADGFRSGLSNGLSTALDGLVNKTMTLGEAARSVFGSILQSLSQIAIQAIATKAASALGNLFGGGDGASQGQALSEGAAKITVSSTVLGAASGLLGLNADKLQQAANTLIIASSIQVASSVAHGGAKVGQGGMVRHGVSPLAFLGAPRYHSGGIAGLQPGEVPAILQTGERVLSRGETAEYERGTNSPKAGIRIVNAFDENYVRDNIGSAETEIMNIVRKNDRSGRV